MDSQPSFLWYDYETFGTNVRSDRPAQFGAIRTDAELNEIGEPINIFCKPSPDYLPDPGACLITGITPEYCLEHGLQECRFAEAIHAAKCQPGTISAGFNSMKFDSEVTRFLFWRNLLDPYCQEWQHKCGRWDLYPVVIAAYTVGTEGIVWPRDDAGKVSFKLEHLTQANGLVHETAHDALSDVRATIALARLIRDRNPALFRHCLSLFRKERVRDHFDLSAPQPVVHITRQVAPEKGCLSLIWPLAKHPISNNEIIVWDLAEDPAQLLTLSPEEIRARVFVKTDELPEGVTRLPLRTIKINCAPVVIGNLKKIRDEVLAQWNFDIDLHMTHAARAFELQKELRDPYRWQAVFARQNVPCDVDEDLYGAFLSNRDRSMLEDLRRLLPEQSKRPATASFS